MSQTDQEQGQAMGTMPAVFFGHGSPMNALEDNRYTASWRTFGQRALDWARPEAGFDWARRFDEAARAVLTDKPSEIVGLRSHGDYARSAPTPDHFIPLIYVAGLAAAANRSLDVLVDGYAYGSLSMAAYTLDAECPTEPGDTRPAAGVPDPNVVPSEDTNL